MKVKPEKIILSGGVAAVTDFGVSKALSISTSELTAASEGLTSLGVALCTSAYMSPEQASTDARIDHRADTYAFGCVAYALLAGNIAVSRTHAAANARRTNGRGARVRARASTKCAAGACGAGVDVSGGMRGRPAAIRRGAARGARRHRDAGNRPSKST